MNNRKIAGLLLSVGGILYVLGTVIGDKYGNTTIFNLFVLLLGVFMVIGSYFVQLTFKFEIFSILLAIAGIGTAALGLLTQDSMIYFMFAGIAYVSFALSAFISYKYEESPLGYISIALGLFTLIALILWVSGLELSPGITVTPIIADFPILLWLISFGAHIIGPSTDGNN